MLGPIRHSFFKHLFSLSHFFLIVGLVVIPSKLILAQTTAAPNLIISSVETPIPIFDKWSDGATLAFGDVGQDGVGEIVVGSGPGTNPQINIYRQDGSLITSFAAFDNSIKSGVIVGVMDANNDGQNDIVAATGPRFGKFVRVFSGRGELLHDWYPIPKEFSESKITSKIETPDLTIEVPAPHFRNDTIPTGKQILVDLSEQRIYTYEDNLLVHTALASTGKGAYKTPSATFKILEKVPVKTYRGATYNLPNVHWNLRFDNRGYFIHEAYWHNLFGTEQSHGCVNLRLEDAKIIYDWSEIGTPVTVSE